MKKKTKMTLPSRRAPCRISFSASERTEMERAFRGIKPLSITFSDKELKELFEAFSAEYPRGAISWQSFLAEWSALFPHASSPLKFTEHLFRSFDQNRDGKLDFAEYVRALSVTKRGSNEQKLSWLFSLFDVNGDGVLTREELTEVVDSICSHDSHAGMLHAPWLASDERTDVVFDELDLNDDNIVTRTEFLQALKQNPGLLLYFEQRLS